MSRSFVSPGQISDATAIFRRLLPYGRNHRRSLGVAAGFSLLLIATDLLRPWPIKVVVDQVILGQGWSLLPAGLSGPENRTALLAVCCFSILAVAMLAGGIAYARTVLLARVGNSIVARIREDVHQRLLVLPLEYHERQRRGDLIVRLTGDASMVSTLLVDGVLGIGQDALMVTGVLLIMFVLNPALTIAAAITVPTVALIVVVYGGQIKTAARGQRKKEGEIATTAAEALSAVPVIQAYGLHERASAFFAKQSRKSGKAGVKAAKLEGAMSRWTEIAIAIGTSVVLFIGGRQVLMGRLSAGELIVMISYVRTLYKPVRGLSARSGKMFKAATGGERLLQILDEPCDLRTPDNPVPLEKVRGDLRISRVWYRYPGAPEAALRGVDLSIRAGEHVAVLGANGAGKSTLVSLLCRLRDVETGQVLLDGQDVRSIDLTELRSRVAALFQRPVLFDGTIGDNVRMGRSHADESDVQEAIEMAGLDAVLNGLGAGADTPVGEIGDRLSGGQRQRVALARAILRDPAVYLLDEPTGALDDSSVVRFREDLLPALRGKTVILVTHDLDLALHADRGIVLEQGKVTFDGPIQRAVDHLRRAAQPEMLPAQMEGARG